MSEEVKCAKCGYVFTEEQKGDCFYGEECPYCGYTLCENCSGVTDESCSSCGRG